MFANVETFFSPFFARKTLANMLDGKDGEEKRKWVNILSHYARICEEFFSLSLPLVIQIVAKVLFKRKFSVKFTVVWWERGSQLRASCTTRNLLLLSARCRNLSSLASSIKIAFKPTFGAFSSILESWILCSERYRQLVPICSIQSLLLSPARFVLERNERSWVTTHLTAKKTRSEWVETIWTFFRDVIENEANLQTAQRGRRWGGRETESEMGSESNKDAFDEEIYCHLSSLIFLFFISFLV